MKKTSYSHLVSIYSPKEINKKSLPSKDDANKKISAVTEKQQIMKKLHQTRNRLLKVNPGEYIDYNS